jgi:hypothetical protein
MRSCQRERRTTAPPHRSELDRRVNRSWILISGYMLCREQALDLTDGLLYTQSQRVSVDLLRIFYPNWWGLPPLRPLNETIVF